MSNPNPTGTAFLNPAQTYAWAHGDVYEIAQTDTLEAAGVDVNGNPTSFGGLGVANQPHQILLNKLTSTYRQQLIDEQSLTALQSLVFHSSVGLNVAGAFVGGKTGTDGYVTLGSTDQAAGAIQLIIQWNWTSFAPWIEADEQNTIAYPDIPNPFPITFATPYQNQVFVILPYITCSPGTALHGIAFTFIPCTPYGLVTNYLTITGATGIRTATGAADLFGDSLQGTTGAADGITGVGWLALGY